MATHFDQFDRNDNAGLWAFLAVLVIAALTAIAYIAYRNEMQYNVPSATLDSSANNYATTPDETGEYQSTTTTSK